MNHQPDLHGQREMNKIGLDTYPLNQSNVFDEAMNALTARLKKSLADEKKSFDGWNELQENDPDRYRELSEEAERYDHSIQYQQHQSFMDIFYLEEQLKTIAEMRILYAFKSLEIHIKKLLSAAFSLQSTRSFYQWDKLEVFLRDRNIRIKEFRSYAPIFQLKSVCNTIKHFGEYDSSLQNLPEFKQTDQLTYNSLEQFYCRVENEPGNFLQELSWAIYQELYDFDDKKIDGMVKELTLRMDKADALKLVTRLQQQYQ